MIHHYTVAKDGALQMTATVKINGSSDNVPQRVVWSSSNNTVASVDDTEKVTGVKAGNATITATAGDGSGASGNADITVTKAGMSPTITTSSLSDGIIGMSYSQGLIASSSMPVT